MAALLRCATKCRSYTHLAGDRTRRLAAAVSRPVSNGPFRNSVQVRSMATPSESLGGLGGMVLGDRRKYYMIGGKGGVGKTSCAASLAGKFANSGHRTIVPDRLEQLRTSAGKVRDLFHDSESMEFIIVTIPTVMARSESSRLCRSLRKETVPIHRLLVNQVLPPSPSECKFCAMKRKEQMHALTLFDAEIRGVPALNFMGNSDLEVKILGMLVSHFLGRLAGIGNSVVYMFSSTD